MLNTLRKAAGLTALILTINLWANAQFAAANLSGTITDEQGAVVANATVVIVDRAKSAERTAQTNADGFFTFAQLAPSSYEIIVTSSGFADNKLEDIVLNASDQKNLRVTLRVAKTSAVVDIADTTLVTDSPVVSTVINRQFIENQPLNGRSFQTLVELSPGVVLTPSTLPSGGQFSVNGQRTSSNYLTVDGVSGNFGSTASVTLYETAGGALPSYSAFGSTTSLASVDAVQEFSIQTSTYAPEFGRQPGAQISLVTRSGTNRYTGNVYTYFRDRVFEANNFFNNASGLARPAIRQYDSGFTLGGPVVIPGFGEGVSAINVLKDKTFFFVSYEGIRARQPFTTNVLRVPSLAARANATGILKDILNSFPLPTGGVVPGAPNEATYVATFSNPSKLDATSVRIDQKINDNFSLFGRYNNSPSRDDQRARFCAASCVARLDYKTETLTLGSTGIFTSNIVNDLRVNFSRSRVNQSYFIDTFGGAIVPPAGSIYPPFTTGAQGYFYLQIGDGEDNTISDGLFSDNVQKQFNIVDSLSYNAGNHALKFGVDYRRLAPVSDGGSYKRTLIFNTVSQLVTGVANTVSINAPQVILEPRYDNLSLFAQDTWRLNPRTTLTYGLRYEIVPAPSEANGNEPVTLTQFTDPGSAQLAPRGTRFYETTYNNFAPRIGISFQPFNDDRTVVRGGFGAFYDLGYNFTGTAFSTGLYPYTRSFSASNVNINSPVAQAVPAPINPSARIARLFAYGQDYKLPYTLQYNVAVEHFLTANDTISLSYVGAQGKRLSRVTSLRNFNPIVSRVDAVTNDGESNYNALQAQYQRRLTRGFQAVASYTFAKSLDTVSEESINNFQLPATRYDPQQDYAPSSFDVRHAFNAAAGYDIPSLFKQGFGKAVLGGWGIDAIARARSATPINILTGRDVLGLGLTSVARPDYVAGQSLYIEDASLPGGRRFNPAAFAFVPVDASGVLVRQGTLGRNVLRGFNVAQFDIALRRNFALTETARIQFRADIFNLFNQANFANPSGILTSSTFGRATQTLNRNLGGLGSIYQIGGPRSVQFALKLAF